MRKTCVIPRLGLAAAAFCSRLARRAHLEAEVMERKDKAEKGSEPRLQSGSKNPLKNWIIKLYLEDPNRSQEKICAKLDIAMEKNPKLAPLEQWQKESGQKTWSHNLRHPKTKNRVKTYLSKIKADALKLLANRS